MRCLLWGCSNKEGRGWVRYLLIAGLRALGFRFPHFYCNGMKGVSYMKGAYSVSRELNHWRKLNASDSVKYEPGFLQWVLAHLDWSNCFNDLDFTFNHSQIVITYHSVLRKLRLNTCESLCLQRADKRVDETKLPPVDLLSLLVRTNFLNVSFLSCLLLVSPWTTIILVQSVLFQRCLCSPSTVSKWPSIKGE